MIYIDIIKNKMKERDNVGKMLLNTEEIAKMLGLSVSTINRLRKEGIPVIKIGNAVRFEPNEVLEWVKKNRSV